MKKFAFAGTLATLLCFSGSAEAQKVYRVSGLIAEEQFAPAFEGFKNKMSEIGYREDKNIRYEFHNAKGDIDALHRLAQKIVREMPDLIVTSSTTATIPVAKLTEGSDLPVVFLSSGNPLKLVRSYGSSGNNLTGIASAILDLTEKRMELFREIAPAVRHVIFVTNPSGTNYEESSLAAREAAKKMGLTLAEIEVPATNAAQVKKQIFLVTRKMGEALLLPPEAALVAATEQFAVQAIKEKIPAIGANVQTVRRGLLAGYSADYYSLGQQGAKLVDKILRGARPTDLPIEQPYKLQLLVNQKTAKAIGIKIPKEILLRADEIIE